MGYIPADRRKVGSVGPLSIAYNVILGNIGRYTWFGKLLLNENQVKAHAQELVERYDVRTPGIMFKAGKLSGGNLQKVVLGREVMRQPRVLIVEQPTRGLDVGAPGDLPQTPRIPEATILPFIIPDTRAHAGILAALAAAFVVWLILRKTPLGYELIITGLSAGAARYGGINVGNRQILASFLAGGLAAWAGLVTVLGVQFRLLDGIAEGTGFVGIVAALLGKLHPAGVVVASILYAGMGVGADAMPRRAGLPSSVIFIVQSLIVLLILASDLIRYYRLNLVALSRSPAGETSTETAPAATPKE